MNVVLCVFNRPEFTERVFKAISVAKPERLFIVADGPRHERDTEKCAQVRAIVDRIDWPCEVAKNYSDHNMGCRKRVSSGLDWVFSLVEDAIILEDDTLPHSDFFRFCTEMLDRYRMDARVGHVNGTNFFPEMRRGQYSYSFSRHISVWGWASWRRAWRYYDVSINQWPEIRDGRWHHDLFPSSDEADYFAANWDQLHREQIDTWDGQWLFSCRVNDMLAIRPAANLVSNLGFGPAANATHTTFDHPVANRAVMPLSWPLIHPPFLIPNLEADALMSRLFFQKTKRTSWGEWCANILNRHRYGSLLRRIPVMGKLWAQHRYASRE